MLKKPSLSQSCKTQTLNPWIFQASSMLILPIIFMPGDFRCCQFLGKFFTDAGSRQTAVCPAFVYFGVFFKWIIFPFRYLNQPQKINWWLNRVYNVRLIPFSSCRAWGSLWLRALVCRRLSKDRELLFVLKGNEQSWIFFIYVDKAF